MAIETVVAVGAVGAAGAVGKAGLHVVGKVVDSIANAAAARYVDGKHSLIAVSQVARVEPITLVDQRAQSLPYTVDIMQAVASVFAGYYLQAVNLSLPVGRVNVIKVLDSLSPNRLGWAKQFLDGPAKNVGVALESLRLPDFTQLDLGIETISLENASENVKSAKRGYNWVSGNTSNQTGPTSAPPTPPSSKASVGMSRDNVSINEAVNLAVGKLLEVSVSDNGVEAKFPVTVRLLSTLVDPKSLVHILSDNSRDTSFNERWHAWKAGELEFWRDLVLCHDLIAEHRRAMINDQTNVYADLLKRRTRNAMAAAVTGTPSIGTASNIAVITKETANELERMVGGRLKDFKVRQRVFANTYLMLLVVIDPEWENVTLYSAGIDVGTTTSIGAIKNSNKGSGVDILDILRAFQAGSNPPL